MNKNAPIGIFDSGVGGITVLGRAVEQMPQENFIYYADTAHFPYGDKTREEVKEYVFAAAEQIGKKSPKMLVIACNTATAAAINDLRERFDFPVLGIEPALKPAVEKADSGNIAVMATSLTLREEKFRRLFQRYAEMGQGDIINLPAAGLADLVEEGHYNDDVGRNYLRELFHGVKPDTIVLGCTHYLFMLPLIRELFPDAAVIDGGEGLARNILRTLERENMCADGEKGSIEVMSSAPAFLPRFDGYFQDIQSILKMLPHKIES